MESESKSTDPEKRLRREIANSNERRRMENINSGFEGLRSLLPHHDKEKLMKLSKAAILQHTSDYIYQLLQEKNKLTSHNNQMKKMITEAGGEASASLANCSAPESPEPPVRKSPVTKRRKTVDGWLESSGDEGVGNMSPEYIIPTDEAKAEIQELRREAMEARIAFERERSHRIGLEEHIAILQQQSAAYSRKKEIDRMMKMEDMDQFSINGGLHDETPRCYTVRNNLQTIVEAIRHLEGDKLFSAEPDVTTSSSPPVTFTAEATIAPAASETVEVPLALTTPSASGLPRGHVYVLSSESTPAVSRTIEIESEEPTATIEFPPFLPQTPQ